MKILIIDDERAIRNSLREILGDEGYSVDVAEDGSAGVQAALAGRYDVIFCDIKMPAMDGTEVLSRLIEEGIDGAIVMTSSRSLSTPTESSLPYATPPTRPPSPPRTRFSRRRSSGESGWWESPHP